MLDTDWSTSGPLAKALEAYAHDAFGVSLELSDTRPAGLPFFMTDRYRFWRGRILGRPAIFMVMTQAAVGALAALEKHRAMIRDVDTDLLILVAPALPADARRRLVEARIAFAVPGVQLYIPEALFDLRSSGPRDRSPPERLSPTAQVLVVAHILDKNVNDVSLTALADRFETAIMSMSRALDELETLPICRQHTVGRQRRLMFLEGGRDLWAFMEARLQSPVRKVRQVRGQLPIGRYKAAGESALSRYTLLASPPIERRAVSAAQWKWTIQHFELELASVFDDDRIEVETWSYNPAPLAVGDLVDRLSLYLSVRDDPDERVQQAAHQLLEQVSW